MRECRHIATGGILVDDSAAGRIRTILGQPYVKYDVTDVDQAKFVRAAGLLAEMYFAAGAREVYTAFHSMPVLTSPDDIKTMLKLPRACGGCRVLHSAYHGTCRMSSDSKQGVVDHHGQAWDVPGLYIADASVLPGTIGVNPQVKIMGAIAFDRATTGGNASD